MSKIKGNIGKTIRITIFITLLLIVFFMISEFPNATSIDFSVIRDKLASGKTSSTTEVDVSIAPIDTEQALEQQQQRLDHLSSERAKLYVDSATKDYYLGSYEDALRRLERAKIHDPANYSIFKLSGQIFFEKNKLRKAFNDWERATQLPHDDRTITRNLDVVRRLIRYSRNEIDRLQRSVHKDPNNVIARARLRELEDQMRD